LKAKSVIFHADDFGANEEVSEHILDCYREGALNSISILPNSARLDRCMEMLAPYREKIKTSIHFNLAEGHCLADPAQVPWLVDERGMFHISFFKVLLLSFTGKRKELKRQIRVEMQAQLKRMLPYMKTLRIDSHQHYHMIPVVLECILDAVRKLPDTKAGARWLAANGRKRPEIEFIRIPAEPILPYLKHPGLYFTYRPINIVKNLVLNMLNVMDSRMLRKYRKRSAVFFGILLSGNMDLKRVSVLLPEFGRIAGQKGMALEILCHPGWAGKAEELMDPQNELCVEFYISENRTVEGETLKRIRLSL